MAENATHVLLVNKDDAEKKVCWHGDFTDLTDAYENEKVDVENCDCGGVSFTIGKYAAYILKK